MYAIHLIVDSIVLLLGSAATNDYFSGWLFTDYLNLEVVL